MLSRGPPTRHHIVVYLYTKVHVSHTELIKQLAINPLEVGAVAWISRPLIQAIVNGRPSENVALPKFFKYVHEEIEYKPCSFLRNSVQCCFFLIDFFVNLHIVKMRYCCAVSMTWLCWHKFHTKSKVITYCGDVDFLSAFVLVTFSLRKQLCWLFEESDAAYSFCIFAGLRLLAKTDSRQRKSLKYRCFFSKLQAVGKTLRESAQEQNLLFQSSWKWPLQGSIVSINS